MDGRSSFAQGGRVSVVHPKYTLPMRTYYAQSGLGSCTRVRASVGKARGTRVASRGRNDPRESLHKSYGESTQPWQTDNEGRGARAASGSRQ